MKQELIIPIIAKQHQKEDIPSASQNAFLPFYLSGSWDKARCAPGIRWVYREKVPSVHTTHLLSSVSMHQFWLDTHFLSGVFSSWPLYFFLHKEIGMFMKVYLCWYENDLNIKTFSLNSQHKNVFHTSEFQTILRLSSARIRFSQIVTFWHLTPGYTHRLLYWWDGSTSSEVSDHIHIESPAHHIDLDEVKILDRELG